jgi:phytoene dehydrogenase-like protein
VIGSGAGGLAAAVPLAQKGLKVLVCEQHKRAGGWTHSFNKQGHKFSPGVHYIGSLQPGESLRKVYEGLGVSQDLAFCEINPDGYDHIYIGDERFDYPKGKQALAERLKARFPHEAQGIDGYLDMVSKLVDGLHDLGHVKNPLDAVQAAPGAGSILRWALRSGQQLVDHFVSDPVLKAILMGQAGDHGMPPSQVSALMQASITQHYFNGAYYPLGGAEAIPNAFVKALQRAGGELRLRTRVEKILLEDKRAVGVRLADGTELRSRYVISNADTGITFDGLIGREHLSPKLRRKQEKIEYSTSALSLFFATDMDLRAAGLDSGNNWYYDNADLETLYQNGLGDHVLHADIPEMMFLTCTTLKDPSKMHNGQHSCEAFAFVGYEPFAKWADSKHGDRPGDYNAMKEDLAWRMIQGLEKRIPGLSKHITFWDLGTPLTNQHYINATIGNLYGTAKSIKQLGPLGFGTQTEFEGLLLCGASTDSHGVAGVTATGLAAARRILNCSNADLLTENGPKLKIYPSEQPTQWPQELQDKIASGAQKVE